MSPRLPTDSDWIDAAFRRWAVQSDNDIEIDEDAKVSVSEDGDGAFVRAWVWVSIDDVTATGRIKP